MKRLFTIFPSIILNALFFGAFVLFIKSSGVITRFDFATNLIVMEEQFDSDLKDISSFSPSSILFDNVRSGVSAFKEWRSRELYSEELFDETIKLSEDIELLKFELLTPYKEKFNKKIEHISTKIDELNHYGITTPLISEEFQQVQRAASEARTYGDFVDVFNAVSRLDFYLQDRIHAQKILYLKENMEKELLIIEELLEQAKGLGIIDNELQGIVSKLRAMDYSSPSSLFQVDKYDDLLIEKKIILKDKIKDELKKVEEKEKRNGYIAIKEPEKRLSGKSIEISIGEQVMRLYENGEQVFSTFVVTGKNGWETTLGHHRILAKQRNRILERITPPVYRVPVRYWMPFTRTGEGIHDISTRRVFGPSAGRAWNGSHGCVNTPMDAVRFVYYWAEVGTPVIVYK